MSKLDNFLEKLLEESEISELNQSQINSGAKQITNSTYSQNKENSIENPKEYIANTLMLLYKALKDPNTKEIFKNDPNVVILNLIWKKTKEYLIKVGQLKNESAPSNIQPKENSATPLNTGFRLDTNPSPNPSDNSMN